MAEVIKLERELPTVTLRFALEPTDEGPTPTVQLDVDRGSDILCRLTLWPEDLGKPPAFDNAAIHYDEPSAAISNRHWPILRRAITTAMMDGDSVLWLELTAPVGHMALLPWERMFEPIVGPTPIVRIPNFSLFAPIDVERIDIAVCLSEPEAKEPFGSVRFLQRLAGSLRMASSHPILVHIFTDAATYSDLRRSLPEYLGSPGGDVMLHDPASAPKGPITVGEASVIDPAGDVTNPWLLWMIDEMREYTADIVHFVTHGYLNNGQSALALAESPTHRDDPLWARFIGPNQVTACLAQMGAWAVGFTSPEFNFSSLGLRQLFDDVSRLRAGPVLHHSAGEDPLSEQLAEAYDGLFACKSPSFSRAVSMYAHPGLFRPAAPPSELPATSYADALVSNLLTTPEPTTPGPGWVTSTRRYLEQAVARTFPDQAGPVSPVQRASGKGLEDALKFVDGIIKAYEGPQR